MATIGPIIYPDGVAGTAWYVEVTPSPGETTTATIASGSETVVASGLSAPPIDLPGTLPSPGTLSAGQSASWEVQSAGGAFNLSVPATGAGTLTAAVNGGAPATLTGTTSRTGVVTLHSGSATLVLAVTSGSLTLGDITVADPISIPGTLPAPTSWPTEYAVTAAAGSYRFSFDATADADSVLELLVDGVVAVTLNLLGPTGSFDSPFDIPLG